MLLNKSYYYWYYRLVFYLDWLFQYRRGLMSTFNMKYIFTKLSLKTCIYCFFSSSLCLRPLPSPSFFCRGFGRMVYFMTGFTV